MERQGDKEWARRSLQHPEGSSVPPVKPGTQREMLETAERKSEDTPGQNGPGIPMLGDVAVPERGVRTWLQAGEKPARLTFDGTSMNGR